MAPRYDLNHGVEVLDGTRYSAVFWLTDTQHDWAGHRCGGEGDGSTDTDSGDGGRGILSVPSVLSPAQCAALRQTEKDAVW